MAKEFSSQGLTSGPYRGQVTGIACVHISWVDVF